MQFSLIKETLKERNNIKMSVNQLPTIPIDKVFLDASLIIPDINAVVKSIENLRVELPSTGKKPISSKIVSIPTASVPSASIPASSGISASSGAATPARVSSVSTSSGTIVVPVSNLPKVKKSLLKTKAYKKEELGIFLSALKISYNSTMLKQKLIDLLNEGIIKEEKSGNTTRLIIED